MTTFKLFSNHLKISLILLAVIESVLFFSTVFIATAIRFDTIDFFSPDMILEHGNTIYKALTYMIVQLLAMTALGQYQAAQYRGGYGTVKMVSRVLVSMIIVAVVLVIIFYIFPATRLGRGVASITFILSLASIITIRQIFFHTVDGNLFVSRILVFGIGKNAANLLADNESVMSRHSYKIIGFISTPSQDLKVPKNQVVELEDCLLKQAVALGADEIVLALDDRRNDFPTQHLLECKLAGINIIDPVSFLEREQGKVTLSLMNPSWMIYNDGFTVSRFKTFLSRSFDILASLSILILAAPFMLLTTFLISAESGFKGAVFYRQQRVGKGGQQFDLLKFRSMHENAEVNGAQWAIKNDSRVTIIGRFIRKTRIDELPQILNILKGDMRLVGPRPERPEFVNKLSKSIGMYNQRHSVKPGLAGWAQLKYPYGSSDEDAYQKLQYDLYYIKNANLVMDFFILLQTIEVVCFGKEFR